MLHVHAPMFCISIHAPAKGATILYFLWESFRSFQSTLPQRERRLSPVVVCEPSKHFNPRSRKGSDCSRFLRSAQIYISIHAPAKGATCSDQPIRYYRLFQSTLPQRERLSIHNPDITALYFNPRSRKGSDWLSWHLDRLLLISIHAPAKGATPTIE